MLVIAGALKDSSGNELTLPTIPHKGPIIALYMLYIMFSSNIPIKKYLKAYLRKCLNGPPSPSVYPSHVNRFQHSQLPFCIMLHQDLLGNIGDACQGCRQVLINFPCRDSKVLYTLSSASTALFTFLFCHETHTIPTIIATSPLLALL